MTWKVLELFVQSEPSAIRTAVRGVTEAWGRKARRHAVRDLAAALDDKRMVFVLKLLDDTAAPPRRLALELIPGMPGVNANVRRNSREALRDRRLPHPDRLAATKWLVRGLDPAGKGTALMLRAYVAGLGRKRILERLDEVDKEFNNPPAMELVRTELRTLEKLKCPRCGSLRRRKNMADHLWNRHQMFLVGHRARTATQALDERLAQEPPTAALVEFHRELLARGLHDEEAIAQLCGEAAERYESICPHCYAFVPMTEPPVLQPAEVAPGRISAEGCSVALSEVAGQARLWIQSDTKVIFDGRDPLATAAPQSCKNWAVLCSIIAMFSALLLPVPWHVVGALAMMAASAVLLALAHRWSQIPHDPLARAVDLAWQKLIPELPPGNAVARISLASIGRGKPVTRTAQLAKAVIDAEQAATLGAITASALSSLWWLQFVDVGDDPLPTFLDRVRRCLNGELPLRAAADVLELWRRNRPARSERARMRALLCEQAFESTLGVWDIVELGRAFPALGFAFGSDDVDGLARLCLVWEQRQIRPWQSCGPTATIFELCRNSDLAVRVLETTSDVLLYHRLPSQSGEDSESLLLCGRGMVFREAVVRDMPGDVRVRACEEWRGGGYEVRLGPHRLRFTESPGPIVQRLKAWADFFLGDFLPRADGVLKYRASAKLGSLLAPAVGRCPACAMPVIPLAGQIGVTTSAK